MPEESSRHEVHSGGQLIGWVIVIGEGFDREIEVREAVPGRTQDRPALESRALEFAADTGISESSITWSWERGPER